MRELERCGRKTALNLAQAFAEYATTSGRRSRSARAIDEFNREVDEVRDHVARLEKSATAAAASATPEWLTSSARTH